MNAPTDAADDLDETFELLKRVKFDTLIDILIREGFIKLVKNSENINWPYLFMADPFELVCLEQGWTLTDFLEKWRYYGTAAIAHR